MKAMILFLLHFFAYVHTKEPPHNVSDFVSTTYSKVSKASSVSKDKEQGRSDSGQKLYSQSSTADITRGQNLKRYFDSGPVYRTSKVDIDKDNPLPGKGEVVQIQKRFHPPPFFYINPPDSPSGNGDSSSEVKRPVKSASIVYANQEPMFPTPNPPFSNTPPSNPPPNPPSPPRLQSFSSPDSSQDISGPGPDSIDLLSDTPPPSPPMPTQAQPDPKPPKSLYDSPYNSYNPPMKNNNDQNFNLGPIYPPVAPPPETKPPNSYLPPQNSYLPPSKPSPMMQMRPKPIDSYLPPQMPKPKPMAPSYNDFRNSFEKGPEIVHTVGPPMDHHHEHSGHLDYDHSYMEHDHPPPPDHDHGSMNHHHDHSEMEHDHPPMDHDHPPANHDQPPMNHDHHGSMKKPDNGHDMKGGPSDDDLSPPPMYPNLPEYVDKDPHQYDFGDHFPYHHHHVYHEVKKKTTTTEAPKEDKRVNNAHYSYYYLGRKLWYIPLYFSVYFIIYITVLILKSIARHKVTYVHTYHAKEARSFNEDGKTANLLNNMANTEMKYAMK